MAGMTKPRKYAAGTANVDDDFLNRRSSISLDELSGLSNTQAPSLAAGLLSPELQTFTPFRLDTSVEESNAPATGSVNYSNPNEFIPQPDRETQLRNNAELAQSIRDDLAPVKSGHRLGLKYKLNKGTEKVPGKGDGKKDTVPAVLAPGEAVLNKAAAEHLGRGFIKQLNQYGMTKMGMVEPDEEGHYACGTEEVMMKKGKK